MKNETIRECNVQKLWASKYPEVELWLKKMQIKDKNAMALYRFCEWAKKTPSELLALKKDPANKEAEKLLDLLVASDIMSNAKKYWCVNATRSFFKHNYIDLAKAAGSITLEKVKPYNKPKKEELRKLWNNTVNLRDKALVTFVCSTAIAKETLTNLKWKHIEEGWENVDLPCINIPPELIKGKGIGKYKGVRQITFLTPEAKRDLAIYKEWIEKQLNRKLTPEDYMWLNAYAPYEPLGYDGFGYLIWNLSKQTGVKFSWHDARRHVETALEEVKIHPNWARKIRGRKVRGEESPYSLPAIEQLRAKFKEAVDLLQFTIEKTIDTKELQLQTLINQAIANGLPPERVEEMKKLFREKKLTPEDAAKMMRSELRQLRSEAGGLSFEQRASETISRILVEAFKNMKEELKKET